MSRVPAHSALEIYASVGEVLVVEVVLYFVHIGDDVGERHKFLGIVPARQTQACRRRTLRHQMPQVGFSQQAIVDRIVDFIADDELETAILGATNGLIVGLASRLSVLLRSQLLRAEVVGSLIEPLTPFVKIELIFEERLDVADENVLTDAPVLDELYEGDVPAIAKRPCQEAQSGARLAFTVTGIDDYDRVFRPVTLECHTAIIAVIGV